MKKLIVVILMLSTTCFAGVSESVRMSYILTDSAMYTIQIKKYGQDPEDHLAYIESNFFSEDEEEITLKTDIDIGSCLITEQTADCIFAAEALYYRCVDLTECIGPIKKGVVQFKISLSFDLKKSKN